MYTENFYESEVAFDINNGDQSNHKAIYNILDKNLFDNINDFRADPISYAESI